MMHKSYSHISLWLTTLTFVIGQGPLPQMTPFFFLCNYHGNIQELGQKTAEVKLSVAIDGNPDSYIPGQLYQGENISQKTFYFQGSIIILKLV